MKLVMTLLVRDEDDIVAANIDYHLSRGVDFIIATDNLSVDGTPGILERYPRQGRLHAIRETSDDYAQHAWVTRMARMAATDFGADWVINSDADEFWWPEADASLKACLARVPAEVAALSVPRDNFPPSGEPSSGPLPFYESHTLRDTASRNPLGGPLPPKTCHRAFADVEVAQGNHRISRGGTALSAVAGAMLIFHLPIRSYAQFENKIRLGGAAYVRNTVLPSSVGVTWRRLYELYGMGGLPEYYRRQIPPRESLQGGRYVQDVRLRDWMRALRSRPG